MQGTPMNQASESSAAPQFSIACDHASTFVKFAVDTLYNCGDIGR
jgi:hypothetical protein